MFDERLEREGAWKHFPDCLVLAIFFLSFERVEVVLM